jgi:hypothetical protein
VPRGPSTHETAIWYLDNNVLIGGNPGPTFPPSWDLRCVADFNGDGKPDYLLYNVSTGRSIAPYPKSGEADVEVGDERSKIGETALNSELPTTNSQP